MKMSEWKRWILSPRNVVLGILLIGISSYSYSVEQSVDRANEGLTLILGESMVLKTEMPTTRVAVTDPKVADVKVLTPNQVLLQGLKVGSTDLIIWGQDESKAQQWKVKVVLDVDCYAKKLQSMFPDCPLKLSESRDSLVIEGFLRNANQAQQIHNYLDKDGVKYVDMTSVSGVQQVQLQVRVAEVSRSVIRALGVNFVVGNDNFFGINRLGSANGGAIVPSVGPQAGTPSSAVSIIVGSAKADFALFLQALAENQYLRLLANPTLVAMSGEEASFLAGGEYPIPVVQGTGGVSSTAISIEYKEYGVRLNFRPQVLGDGTIKLYTAPEVSELSSQGAVVIQGFQIPSLVTRKAETTLELKSGQTFAMAGLIQNKDEAIRSIVPGLGDLPVLGPLFRSVRYQRSETELIILVTATLVEPMSITKLSPLPGFLHTEPNDWELYIEGKIEGEEPAKITPEDAARLKEFGIDNLIGPGAWDNYGQAVPASQADIRKETQIKE